MDNIQPVHCTVYLL